MKGLVVYIAIECGGFDKQMRTAMHACSVDNHDSYISDC